MERLRQKRVASLIKEELSRLLISKFQSPTSGLVSVTKVHVSSDLKTAHVSISVFGEGADNKAALVDALNSRQGYLRKCVASKIKLKYNPKLIFSLDSSCDQAEKIEDLLNSIKE